ncbi:MAG: hypothetical protein NT013_08860 [Planctomycetia bacterium]|nr:hypothetical protein [Planctomycetia bacterium]
MSGTPEEATVNNVCHALHQLVGGLPAFGFPYLESQIPQNGIYVLFEDGEFAHGTNRVVRIGSHTGNNQLRSRLKQHFLNEIKDRSIFRKNIGRCLLNRDHDPFLDFWELDLTSRAARDEHAGKIDFQKQNRIEKQVSEYIRNHFRFVVFEVRDKAKRLDLESKITSTVSLCEKCGPSATWLGRHSPKSKIQSSGLWQVNELHKTPLFGHELQELHQSLGV